MKVKQFPGATITDIYDHLKPTLKRLPEFAILHIAEAGALIDIECILPY